MSAAGKAWETAKAPYSTGLVLERELSDERSQPPFHLLGASYSSPYFTISFENAESQDVPSPGIPVLLAAYNGIATRSVYFPHTLVDDVFNAAIGIDLQEGAKIVSAPILYHLSYFGDYGAGACFEAVKSCSRGSVSHQHAAVQVQAASSVANSSICWKAKS
jgi:hypothetical protein